MNGRTKRKSINQCILFSSFFFSSLSRLFLQFSKVWICILFISPVFFLDADPDLNTDIKLIRKNSSCSYQVPFKMNLVPDSGSGSGPILKKPAGSGSAFFLSQASFSLNVSLDQDPHPDIEFIHKEQVY